MAHLYFLRRKRHEGTAVEKDVPDFHLWCHLDSGILLANHSASTGILAKLRQMFAQTLARVQCIPRSWVSYELILGVPFEKSPLVVSQNRECSCSFWSTPFLTHSWGKYAWKHLYFEGGRLLMSIHSPIPISLVEVWRALFGLGKYENVKQWFFILPESNCALLLCPPHLKKG